MMCQRLQAVIAHAEGPLLLSPAPTDKKARIAPGGSCSPRSAIRPLPSGKMMAGHHEHSRRLKIHAALSFGYAGPRRTSDWRTSLSCSEPRTAIRSPLGFDLDLRKEGGRRPLPFAPEEYGGNIMRVLRTLAVVGLIAIAGWTPTCAAERVDLLLVLAADISRSVDEVKFQLQRSGYAAAFSDSRVIEAIRSGPNRRIAVTLVEWSGPLSQKIVIDWMVISDDKTARLFGDHIVEASRAFADSTSISAGIDFAMTQLDRAAYQTSRRAIDVSGDGDNNSGRDVTAARDEPSLKASRSTGSSS